MKRPMALAGFSLLVANVYCVILGNDFAKTTGILLFVFTVLLSVFLYVKQRYNSRQALALLGCFFFCAIGCFTFSLSDTINVQPLRPYQGTTATCSFVVTEQGAVFGEKQSCTVSIYGLYPDKEKSVNARLTAPSAYVLEPGQWAKGEIAFSKTTPSADEKSNRIHLKGTLQTFQPTETRHSYYHMVNKINTQFKQAIDQNQDSQSAELVTAITLGDTGNLSDQVKANFKNSGMWHLVAVSGLHINMVGGLLMAVLFLCKIRRPWLIAICIALVWGFTLITGASYSSIRAAIMFSCFAASRLTGHKPDPLNTLGLSCVIILLMLPASAGSIGFLASISACLGLIVLYPPTYRLIMGMLPNSISANPLVKAVCSGICITVCANLAIFPCNLICFGRFSLLSPFANLLGVPLSGIILALGLCGGLLSAIPGFAPLGSLLFWLARIGADWLIKLAQLFGSCKAAQLQQVTVWCFVAFIVVLFAGIWFYQNRHRFSLGAKRITAFLMALLLLCSCLIPPYPPNTMEVAFIQGNFGIATVLFTNHQTILLGSGNCYAIQELLTAKGVLEIDAWILPDHGDYDEQLYQIRQTIPITRLITNQTVQIRLGNLLLRDLPVITGLTAIELGDITVTANQTFDRFSVVFGNNRLTLTINPADKATQGFCMIDHAGQQKDYIVDTNTTPPTYYPTTKTTLLRLKNGKGYVYHPNFIF